MVTKYLFHLKESKIKEYQSIKLSQNIYQKYFQDEAKEDVENIIEKAITLYFKEQIEIS